MIVLTRRDAIRLLSTVSAGALWAAAQSSSNPLVSPKVPTWGAKDDLTPPLAPGTPTSPQRVALIDAFKEKSAGLEKRFEARTYKGDWAMPYR